jgi:hypothetical protein
LASSWASDRRRLCSALSFSIWSSWRVCFWSFCFSSLNLFWGSLGILVSSSSWERRIQHSGTRSFRYAARIWRPPAAPRRTIHGTLQGVTNFWL